MYQFSSHWQKGSTWISRSPILFPGSYPAYFKNGFFYRKSSSFECMKRKMMLKPGSEIGKVFEVSCRDWGCIFPTVLGVLFKIVGIPRVTDLGNDGGLQKKWICFKHLQDQNYCQFYILMRRIKNCDINPWEILKPGFHFSESYELKMVLVKVFVWIIFHLINCFIFLYWELWLNF